MGDIIGGSYETAFVGTMTEKTSISETIEVTLDPSSQTRRPEQLCNLT